MNINTTVQTFQFQSNQVRVEADEHGNPLFCAKDVCTVLGYANHKDIVKKLCRVSGVSVRYLGVVTGKKSNGTDAMQNVPTTFIDEGNLYRLIIKSNKPEAEPFESWVCDEVLPTIRKTGSYQMPSIDKPANNAFWVTVDEWNAALFANSKSDESKANRKMVLQVEKELANGERQVPIVKNTKPYGLKSLSRDVLSIAEFEEAQLALIHAQEALNNAVVQISAAEYQTLMICKTLRVPSAVLALMEDYGIPRAEICEAAGITRNNFRQHLHLARKSGGAV